MAGCSAYCHPHAAAAHLLLSSRRAMIGVRVSHRLPASARMLTLFVVAVAVLSACGSATDPAAVVKIFISAILSGDGRIACAQLNQTASRQIINLARQEPSLGATTCAEYITKYEHRKARPLRMKVLGNATYRDASVSSERATVVVGLHGKPYALRFQLAMDGGRWYLTSTTPTVIRLGTAGPG